MKSEVLLEIINGLVPKDRTWLVERNAADTGVRFVLWTLAIILSASGCTILTAEIDPSGIPSPAVEPIPATVGVYYGDALREYEHTYSIRSNTIF